VTKKPEHILSELMAVARSEKIKVNSDLKASVHEKLCGVQRSQQKKLSRFFRPVLAVAAVVAVVCSISFAVFYSSSEKTERHLIHESTVAGGKPVTIKLVYESLTDIKNVSFSLDLDDGVKFYSENDYIRSRKRHEWKGSLKKGSNTIPFVVETEKLGKMKIIAKARSGKFNHIQEIVLVTKEKETVISMFSISADN
jgi:hypothetical protein